MERLDDTMSIKEKTGVLFLALTLIIAFLLWKSSGVIVSFEDGSEVRVEVVKEPLEITTGLMFREELEVNKGMLFSYGYDDRHSIWMKNMNFPIDIIWIDSNNKIVDIKKAVEPCNKEPCTVYRPIEKARYVLEVSADLAENNNIVPGQIVSIHQPSLF